MNTAIEKIEEPGKLNVAQERQNEMLPMSGKEIRNQVNTIQEIMKAVMKEDTHYGIIPGAGNKPTLLKPGAEKIMMTFRLSADPIIEDLSKEDEIRYRIKVNIAGPSGNFLGAGVGECSSNEEKYKWRACICDEEWEDTPEDDMRIKYKKGKGGTYYQVQQVRTNPADVANTVLKMAKKRALVDGILTCTGASDIFTQDIEDMPDEIINSGKKQNGPPPPPPPKAETTSKEPGTPEQKHLIESAVAHLIELTGGKGPDIIEAASTSNKGGKTYSSRGLDPIMKSKKWADFTLDNLNGRLNELMEGKK